MLYLGMQVTSQDTIVSILATIDCGGPGQTGIFSVTPHTSIPLLLTGEDSGADSPPCHWKRGHGHLLGQLLPAPPEVCPEHPGEGT